MHGTKVKKHWSRVLPLHQPAQYSLCTLVFTSLSIPASATAVTNPQAAEPLHVSSHI
jgi:hypothetical protein